jgi:photosystem II stability/assembly factor-like uncharacterized protein
MPAAAILRPPAGAVARSGAGRRVARAILMVVAAVLGASVALAGGPIAPGELARLVLLDAVSAGGRLVAVGEQGTIALSDDEGKTWRRATTPGEDTLTAVRFVDAEHGWAVGHHGLIVHSDDGGLTWRAQAAPQPELTLLNVWFADRKHGIAVGAYGALLRTDDGGDSWQAQLIASGEDRHLNAIAGGVDGKVYIVGEGGLFYASHDGGRTWAARKTPYAGSLFGVLRSAARTVVVFGLRGHILRSADEGLSWQEIGSDGAATLLGGGSSGATAIALCGRGGMLLLSRDQGKTFKRQPMPVRKDCAAVLPLADRSALLVGQGGPLLIRLGNE